MSMIFDPSAELSAAGTGQGAAVRAAGASLARGLLKPLGTLAAGLVLPLLLLALWQIAAQRRWLPEQILPAPSLVLSSLRELWDSGDLANNLEVSASRVAWGLLWGGGAGLVLGLAMGLSRGVRAYLQPTFDVVAQFPVLGWIPLLIIFVGIEEPLKVTAIAIAVSVPMAVNTLRGIANIPPTLFDVARVLRFTPSQVIVRVVLPAAAPSLFNGLRQSVMQAWLTLVFVELLSSSEGIGYLMVWGRQLMQMDLVVVGMIVIGAVGIVIELLLRAIESRMQPWRRTAY